VNRSPGLTLAPSGGPARSPIACAQLAFSALSPERAALRTRLLAGLSDAFAVDYPDNLFCDLDALAGHLARLDDADAVRTIEQMTWLSRQFGCRRPLRFRFVHDFLYGFDWSRWAAKEPSAREGIGPYDLPFLTYLSSRGTELEALVAQGDAKYGPLLEGDYRNPYGFARDPASEAWLLRELSCRGSLPFECWRHDATPRLVPFAAEREALAAQAGLVRDPVAPVAGLRGSGA